MSASKPRHRPHHNRQLLNAVTIGDAITTERLLKSGVSPNVRNRNNFTPAMETAFRGQEQCLSLLIAAGCDLNACTREGMTASFLAAWKDHRGCLALLIAAGINLDTQNNTGETAASWAIQFDHHHCLSMLIEAGCDLDVVGFGEITAFKLSRIAGKPQCHRILRTIGDRRAIANSIPLASTSSTPSRL